ncbi:hypothetical protein ACFJIX_05095 [Roseateles sp. UC29_93]|uniref:hypothetical protein n=1 Tax=Roseateles sp. UC29_93 TaxID=3350177 RepID=UPI00366D5161
MHEAIQVLGALAIDVAGGVTEVAVGAFAVDVQHMGLEGDEGVGFDRRRADDRRQGRDARRQAGRESIEAVAARERFRRLPGSGLIPPGVVRPSFGRAGGHGHRGVERRVLEK